MQCYSLQGGGLPPWQQGERHDAAAIGTLAAGRGEIIRQTRSERPTENVSQNSRTPHPLNRITKSPVWQPGEGEVGAEG